MESREDRLTGGERRELEGYVASSTALFRVFLFLLAAVVIGALSWRIQSWLSITQSWWLLAPVIFAALLFGRSRRWTGGREFRRGVRADLAANRARVYVVRVVDAIEVQEVEDEGPTFFLKTDGGETLVMAGQYLDPYRARGFPWRLFEIREGYDSGSFLGLKRIGERIKPSMVRGPLFHPEIESSAYRSVTWKILELSFDRLRQSADHSPESIEKTV